MSDPRLATEHVRVLLLQARNTPDMERQEQECFLERCRIRSDQLQTVNVTRDPLREEQFADIDALLIGGAGEYSAHLSYPWMDSLLAFVQTAVERRIPTFGSCWGHQIIARALGGEVIHDSERAELGCREVHLTEAGRSDPLFSRFPDRFMANMGHHDRVVELPSGAVELACNEQPFQAFRLADVPVYGTQFHSELDAKRERERLIAYRDYYREDLPNEDDFQRVVEDLAETTEVDRLLYDFLATYAVDAAPTPATAEAPPLTDPANIPSPSADGSVRPESR
jgi:GMP synthase (glutamine-hydrolysing)